MGAAFDPIPADVRSRLRGLQLLSRHSTGARGIGLHASRSRGAGMEFAQYRSYEQGDELRQVDWKLYARSDRFFVRESERESPLTVWLLLDATASAGQADGDGTGGSRLDAIKALAACVAELALRQGDAFGMVAVQGGRLRLMPAAIGARQRDRLWLELHALDAGGAWPPLQGLRPLWERVAANDLVLMIGDGFDEAGIALAEQLAAARREVLHLQVLTTDERDFPFRGGRRFVDPETGEELLGDGAALRGQYLARFGAAQRALAARLQVAGIRQAVHYLDQPLDASLRQLLQAPAGAR